MGSHDGPGVGRPSTVSRVDLGEDDSMLQPRSIANLSKSSRRFSCSHSFASAEDVSFSDVLARHLGCATGMSIRRHGFRPSQAVSYNVLRSYITGCNCTAYIKAYIPQGYMYTCVKDAPPAVFCILVMVSVVSVCGPAVSQVRRRIGTG